MAEIKNTFTSGKMNKDLDERLIPKGEYRDALNIDVVNSESSDVGSIENCFGTVQRSFLSQVGNTCIGSCTYGKEDKISVKTYYQKNQFEYPYRPIKCYRI